MEAGLVRHTKHCKRHRQIIASVYVTWIFADQLGKSEQRAVKVPFKTLYQPHLPAGICVVCVGSKHLLQFRSRIIISTFTPKFKTPLIGRGYIR